MCFLSDAILNRNTREYILICYYLGLELLRTGMEDEEALYILAYYYYAFC